MVDLFNVLRSLSKKRPIFHSEADFQHALAWELHEVVPDANVRLEYRHPLVERTYLDIWIGGDLGAMALELKYVTRRFSVTIAGEPFDLSNHGAHPPRRYDFIKDLTRLERVVRAVPHTQAAAIFLTNDDGYWIPPRSGDQIDTAFRVHEGRVLQGCLPWGPNAGGGTISGRQEPLILEGAYRASWADYAELQSSGGRFRYLLIDIPAAR